jgi:acyl carrier protein
MSINDFILKLEQELESFPENSIKPDSDLKSFPEWSSMYALIIIALIDTEYNVTITGEDLRNMKSVQELYDLILSRK